jgi:O-methyltransferase
VNEGIETLSANIFNMVSRLAFYGRVRFQTLSADYREIVNYDEPDVMRSIVRIRQKYDLKMENREAYMIHSAVKSTSRLSGDIAEVGVYRGGSAKVICQAKGDRHLHLFDTFEGLPHDSEVDWFFSKGDYSANFEDVKREFAKERNVHLYKGLFPDTAGPISDRMFSFVHLDVDLYSSTLACLNFFYDRMEPGGLLISHDYGYHEGVKKAFTEFFKDKPEVVVRLVGSQCLVTKA